MVRRGRRQGGGAGNGGRQPKVFTCRRSLLRRCCRSPGRWLRCSQHPEGGQRRCPGNPWGRWLDWHPGSGRRSRGNRPPQRGAAAWATEPGGLVGLVLCLKRRCRPPWRKTLSKSGSRWGQWSARWTHSASNHLVSAVCRLHLGLDVCRSHWSGKWKEHTDSAICLKMGQVFPGSKCVFHSSTWLVFPNKQILYFLSIPELNCLLTVTWCLLVCLFRWQGYLQQHSRWPSSVFPPPPVGATQTFSNTFTIFPYLSLSWKKVPHLGLSSAAGSNRHWGFPSASHRLLYHRNGFWLRGSNVL